MTPVISVIVPVYREPLEIGRCLAYLAQCPGIERCETIVCEGDGGRSMTPTGILPVRIIRSAPGRGRQLNVGAAAAAGAAFVFLHVDTRPPRDFVEIVTRTLRRRAAGAFDLHIESGHPFVRAVSLVGMLRSRMTRVPYGDQAHFIWSRTFREIGGYAEIPIMEDVALMRRLHANGETIALVRPPASTSGRRWELEGAVRTTLRNWRIMLAYKAGLRPESLARRYRPQAELESNADRIVVFHRALRLEGVKTRLAAHTGAQTALELYRAMLDDTIASTRLRDVRRHFFVDSPAAGLDHPGNSTPQIGADLWDRMDDALRRVIAVGANRVVLVGSDIPGLSRSVLHEAFARLATVPLVLGPSVDGGFYLIGLRADAYRPDLFQAARRYPDRSARVIERTANRHGLEVSRLRVLSDVDSVNDLADVLKDRSIAAPHLKAAVRRLRRRDGSPFPILNVAEDA